MKIDFRQKCATHLANLAGEKTIIDDLSIVKVIDMMMQYGRECASYGYDYGKSHGLSESHPDSPLFQMTSKQAFLNNNFPNEHNTNS